MCFVLALPCYSQEEKGYQISAEISGLKDGTLVSLKSLEGKEGTAIAKYGKFIFKGKVEVAGTPYTLGIAGKEQRIELLMDNSLKLQLRASFENLPDCNFGIIESGSYLDFLQRVQAPFSAAYRKFEENKKTDSISTALSKQDYNVATQTYIKEVYLWIGMNPGSYYTPFLISFWWPEIDKANAYNRLTKKAKNSYYGRQLFAQVEAIKQENK